MRSLNKLLHFLELIPSQTSIYVFYATVTLNLILAKVCFNRCKVSSALFLTSFSQKRNANVGCVLFLS
ncbi:hypothetical protein BJY04DRAFT_39752 [Aspergillus karnatakaensis]|uniref:uncharacterized protein n=1 Tax=Aspergillus karnatakaensis TaxID=1810916 RepID=UPI003CCDCBE9